MNVTHSVFFGPCRWTNYGIIWFVDDITLTTNCSFVFLTLVANIPKKLALTIGIAVNHGRKKKAQCKVFKLMSRGWKHLRLNWSFSQEEQGVWLTTYITFQSNPLIQNSHRLSVELFKIYKFIHWSILSNTW